MELQDYLRMIKRGWLAILLITALFLGLAAVYLVVTPKQYESATTLFVSAGEPRTNDDLQQGVQFSSRAVTTYAPIIDSATVLGPIAAQLRPQRDIDDLVAAVSAAAPTDTTLINIVATGPDPAQAAALANATAASAIKVIPALENSADGRPLVRISQIRRAIEPTTAATPKVKNVLAIGLIVGLSLGLAFAIARQSLDTRIRRVEDVVAVTPIPLVGVLPQLKRGKRQGLVMRDEPDGATGDAFRVLRTNLRFLEPTGRRSLVFSSVIEDADGAQTAANLAWSLTQAGRRVLLVDLDLRRPSIGDVFGLGSGSGMGDVLAGRADLAHVTHNTDNSRLRVVLSGAPEPGPSDLLSSPTMAATLRRMEQENDYVVLCAPPLLEYSDAAAVAAVSGATFVTIPVGRAKARDLGAALATLANVRVEPLGLVLTGARDGGSRGLFASHAESWRPTHAHERAGLRNPPAQPV